MWVDLWVGNMARQISKLTALTASRIKAKGLYSDGNNLYLQVSSSGAKSWLFRFMLNGKSREMGLGAYNAVSLAEARERASEARRLLSLGRDPIAVRNDQKAKVKLEEERARTFKQCAEAYIEAHRAGWRNSKHVSQWTNTLATYAYPVFGDTLVGDIDILLVQKVLIPIWNTKTETAKRVRGRIEAIFDWAITSDKNLKIENPARWKGGLQNLFPKAGDIRKVKHHPALPYARIAEFMLELSVIEDISARALELTILTASRTSEVIGAKWEEFNLSEKVWIIPADRIKAKREHRVPLSGAALDILYSLKKACNSVFVFPGRSPVKSMSNMALLELLKRIKSEGRPHFTVHGFRSSFRDWAAEQTNFSREVCEMSLSHAIGDKVEAAYRRGDLFEKRRKLMDAWARYCYQPKIQGNVLKINKRT